MSTGNVASAEEPKTDKPGKPLHPSETEPPKPRKPPDPNGMSASDMEEEARVREEFADCFAGETMPFPPLRDDLGKPEHAIHLKPDTEVPNFRGYQLTAGEREIF